MKRICKYKLLRPFSHSLVTFFSKIIIFLKESMSRSVCQNGKMKTTSYRESWDVHFLKSLSWWWVAASTTSRQPMRRPGRRHRQTLPRVPTVAGPLTPTDWPSTSKPASLKEGQTQTLVRLTYISIHCL